MIIMCFKLNDKQQIFTQIALFSFLFLLFFVMTQLVSNAQEEFIFIDEIEAGMEGIGKTVFSGTEIEEFDVQVIDIISGIDINNPYILVKLSGEKIDNDGGISAGMSGSPVYLAGRLAGAISHSWEMSEHNLCLITPIEKMIALFDYIGKEPEQTQNISHISDRKTISIALDNNLRSKITKNIPGLENDYHTYPLNQIDSIHFQYIQSPLLISGFEGRATELLENYFHQQGATFIQNIPDYQEFNTELEIDTEIKELKPGSAVGVQLSTGDASVLTIGTVTYCRDNFVLAFGHPLMHQGNTSYLFSSVYIYHSFPSIVMPFKVGSPYQLLGEVIQDREAGILAQLNQFPRIVSCKINISDLDRNIMIQNGAKIVPQNNIVQNVLSALLIQSIDRTIDRIGQGTAMVQIGVQSVQPGKRITQENMFFSKDDIAIQCGKDLDELFDLIINNYSEDIKLSEIEVDITIREQNQSAMIKEVKLNEKDYFPGDTVEAQITIKPFRKPEEKKIANISLPNDMKTGEAIIMIRGGASPEIMGDETPTQDKEQYLLDGWEDIQKYIKKRVKNNQILAELILINERERMSFTDQEYEQRDETELKVFLDTDFIVEGYHEMYLNIKNDENRSKELSNE
jgi:hypothetical protein